MTNNLNFTDEISDSTVDSILNIDEVEDDSTCENTTIEEEDPAENVTVHNFATSPWSKLGVVGFFFGTGFFVVFLFFSGILRGSSQAQTEEIPSQIPEETLARIENNNGEIFAQAALARQESELRRINQLTPEDPEPEPTPEPRTTPVASTPPNPSPPAPTPVNRSAPREVSPTVRPLPPPTPTPASQPRNVSVPPPPTPVASTPPDPIAELNRLRNIGSFGNIAYVSAATGTRTIPQRTISNNNVTTGTTASDSASAAAKADRTERRDAGNRQNTAVTRDRIERIEPRWQAHQQNLQTSRTAAVNFLPQEAQIFNQRRNRYLVVGQFASGELVTPLVQQQSTDTNQQSNGRRFLARLTEDFNDNEGNVAIARGSLMALEMLSVDGASYAQVQVTSIIKNNTEYPINAGAITVQGHGGRPLIAQQFKDKGGEIAQYDLTVGLISGLGRVGEIINRPDIEDEIEDELFGTVRRRTRISNSPRNIGGAVLEGAFSSLGEIISRRAETSTREILARPNIWYIPQGTQVQFTVNRSLEIP